MCPERTGGFDGDGFEGNGFDGDGLNGDLLGFLGLVRSTGFRIGYGDDRVLEATLVDNDEVIGGGASFFISGSSAD